MSNYLDVLEKVEETGARAWLVGDTVRMLEMGVQPETITLAVDAQDMYQIALSLGTGTVDARGPYPALRGDLLGVPFRAFGLRGSTIEDDLAQRDLSIEAIAVRSDGGIVDPFGGRFDIRNRVIRITGDDVDLIDADPLRILRMLRFAAELEMDIFWKSETDVRKFLELHADRMNSIPPERWGREIMKGIHRRPARFIELCDDYELIPFFMKELDDLRNIPDGQPGGKSLFDHVICTLGMIESRMDTTKLMQNDAFVLAGLFSRIGTRTLNMSDRTKPADNLVNEYLTRWNIPAETIDEVLAIINRFQKLYQPITEERFCAYVLEHSAETVEVALEFAKCVATAEGFIEKYRDALDNNTWNLNQVLRRFRNVSLQTEGASRYLTGREVMNLLHIKPGRRVGELLEGLDMAVGTGKVNSRAKAEEWLKSQHI
ncbi:MAG: CCA tRNA nucleotidyltransferase [Synergistaceae bacterium]|nr:CCA tRNA nucleotidyltransferase [Synergistaceae bacterium]MBR0250845.1 CCA tRNA nucleotidyltransferase [Synergistaceae bacterium]